MRLIIDIPEVDYELAKQRWMRGNDAHKTDYYISKGIPLEDVKAEIAEEFINNPQVHFYGDAEESTASACLEIIDKCIDKESEE